MVLPQSFAPVTVMPSSSTLLWKIPVAKSTTAVPRTTDAVIIISVVIMVLSPLFFLFILLMIFTLRLIITWEVNKY